MVVFCFLRKKLKVFAQGLQKRVLARTGEKENWLIAGHDRYLNKIAQKLPTSVGRDNLGKSRIRESLTCWLFQHKWKNGITPCLNSNRQNKNKEDTIPTIISYLQRFSKLGKRYNECTTNISELVNREGEKKKKDQTWILFLFIYR